MKSVLALGLVSSSLAHNVDVWFGDSAQIITAPETLALGNFADTVCRGVGVEPAHPDFVPTFVKADMFRAPTNFLFTVLTPQTGFLGLPGSAATTATSSVDVKDAFTQFTELVTGSPDLDGRMTLNDRISKPFAGQSVTVAVSGRRDFADVARGHATHGYNFAIAAQEGAFAPLRGSDRIVVDTHADVFSLLTDTSSSSFDLNEPTQRAFVDELQYTFRLLTALGDSQHELHARVSDAIPDSYSFAFTSLADVAAKYSTTSPEYATAMQALNAVLPQLVTLSQSLYPGALVEVVRIQPASAPHTQSRRLLQASEDPPPSDDDVQRYQIVLWFSLFWGIALYVILMGIANQTNKKDTLMYADFNPQWSSGRKGR